MAAAPVERVVPEICRDHGRKNRGGAVELEGLGKDAEALPLDKCLGKKPCPLLANARASSLVQGDRSVEAGTEDQGQVLRAVSAPRPLR